MREQLTINNLKFIQDCFKNKENNVMVVNMYVSLGTQH